MNIKSNISVLKALQSLFMSMLMLFAVTELNSLSGQTNQAGQTEKTRPAVVRTLRAPDTIPGTTFEMREPSFWIARMKNPDEVVMSLGQIQARNIAYQQKMKDFSVMDSSLVKQINQEIASRPGLMAYVPDLRTMSPEKISVLVSGMVEKELRILNGRRSTNILGIPYSDQEIKVIENEMAYSEIMGQVKPQPAITTKTTRLRIIPAVRPEYVGSSSWDMWNFDILPIASPVQILHTSVTGGYLLVLTDRGMGWINSEDAAISSQAEIDKIVKAMDFVICTGEKVPYYTNEACSYVSGWIRLGDRIPVSGSNQRMILVPVRNVNGELTVQKAWLKKDANMHRGYMPYTRRNVVLETFKLLDNLYDWTGGWYGRDHATQLRDIFSVFGFSLSSMGGMTIAYEDNPRYVFPTEGREAQYKAIMSHEPFLTIQTCSSGHSQLFLGEYNGSPIVFDTHGYRYSDKEGNDLVIRRANVGTLAFPDYFLKQTIAFVELK